MEVLAKAARVVVEDGLGISKTLQDGKDFHWLLNQGRKLIKDKNKGGLIKQPGLTKMTLPPRHKKHIDKIVTARQLPDAGCHSCPDTWN